MDQLSVAAVYKLWLLDVDRSVVVVVRLAMSDRTGLAVLWTGRLEREAGLCGLVGKRRKREGNVVKRGGGEGEAGTEKVEEENDQSRPGGSVALIRER